MVFNGTITGTPALATGSGTENDPYQISSAEGLKWFRDKVNNAKTPDETKICAVLTADIDLNNEEWTPIGPSESSAYTGTFDGQGHTVRNLSITGDVKRAGLFGCVIGGAIRKLTVAGSVSCTVDQGWCGGIAGYAERETIENCASLCTVSYTGKDARVGGIVGYVPSSSSMTIICDCYNIGNITGSSDTGGICGYNLSGRIFNCYNVGEITGGNYVSKIVGYGQANNNPTNCYYLSDTDTDPAAKTAAEFADRTVVLKLLKAGRNDSPWDSCQYVATAGITLPVFNGQGDAHNANGGRQEQLRVTKQLFVPFVVGAFGRYPFMCCSLPPKFSKTNDFMLFSRTNEKQPIRSSNGIMRQNPPQKIRDSDADWIFGRDAGKSASQPQVIDVEMT